MKLVDCFQYFNEEVILKLRMEEGSSYVDKMVISESEITHTNKPKLLYLNELDKYELRKCVRCILKPYDYDKYDPWYIENKQRDIMRNKILSLGLDDDDIIIMSDLDEVPNYEVILDKFNPDWGIASVLMSYHYYYLNMVSPTAISDKPKVMTYKFLKNHTESLTDLRTTYKYQHFICNGGWHFSYMGGPEFIKHKIESFAHTELNNSTTTDINYIKRKMQSGEDLFNRVFHYRFLKTGLDKLPKTILNSKDLYKRLGFLI